MASRRPVFVVIGVGTGGGTGAASARLFGKSGYTVAILSRGKESTQKLADEIIAAGGEAKAFPIESYASDHISEAFASLNSAFPTSSYTLRAALFNATTFAQPQSFLDISVADLQSSLQIVTAGFTFAQEVLKHFKSNDIVDGKRGALIFTGATAATRGSPGFSIFASQRTALRAMTQSIAKEFGKENIHVSHVIIDGAIKTAFRVSLTGAEWAANEDVRLDPDAIATTYLNLVNQHRSTWTWELDLRPAHEKW